MNMLIQPLFRVFGIREGGLGALAARGALWTGVGFTGQYAIRLLSTLVLTRLLTPDAFGLMSLATVFLTGIALLSDIGTTPSVVRSRRGEEADFLRTAWTLQAVRGALITLVACLIAWPAAQIYDEPLLFPMISALAFTAFLQGLNSISIALAQRHMAMRQLTLINLIGQVFTTLVTILAAWQTGSVWALVIGNLFGSVLQLALSYLMLPPFSPAFRLERDAVSEILRFGRWILVSTLLTYLGGRGLGAIQGALVPVDILGMIAIAGTISWALGDLVVRLLGNIAFPAISQVLRERPHDAARVLRRIQLLLIGGTLPCFLLLSFFAQDLIDLLYDDRYMVAGTFLGVLALGSAAGVLSMPYQNALLALGESGLHAAVMGAGAVLKIGGAFVGFYVGGVVGMLATVGVANGLVHIVSAAAVSRRGLANPGLDITALAILTAAYLFVLTTGYTQ